MTQPVTGSYRGSWLTSTRYYARDLVEYSGVLYLCAVAHTSAPSFDASKWTAGSLSRTIPEGSGIVFNRPLMVDSNTAADTMQFQYDGARTGYHNEYGELRVIAAKTTTTPLRVKQKASGQTGNLTEWVDISNNVLLAIGPNGEVIGPGAGPWTDIPLTTGISHGAVHAQQRVEPFGVVRIRGSVTSDAGSGFGAGAALATLPAGRRPTAAMTFPSRQAGAGIALTINTDGTITSSTSIGTGGGTAVLLDNITLPTT